MGDFWSSRIFFSSNLVGRIFFSLFSHKLSITFVLHANFFFLQALAGNFFSKSPPPPQELNGRPLNKEISGPTQSSFGKINIIILQKGKTGTKRAVDK